MPEPFSAVVGAYCLGYTALVAYVQNETAISPLAKAARCSAGTAMQAAERSQVLFGAKAAAISELWAMAAECSESGWDSAGAEHINPFAVRLAEDFVRSFPDGLPLPEFAPEPDGSVSLDWTTSRHRRFTVSIGGSRRLAFAWIDGTDRGHGVALFNGSIVPQRIQEGIRSISSHAYTSLRTS